MADVKWDDPKAGSIDPAKGTSVDGPKVVWDAPAKPAARPTPYGVGRRPDGTPYVEAVDALVPRDPSQPTVVDKVKDFPGAVVRGFQKPSVALGAAGALAPTVMQAVPIPPVKAAGAALNNPAGRTVLASGLSGLGALLEGKPSGGPDAAETAVATLLGEVLMGVVGKGRQSTAGAKAAQAADDAAAFGQEMGRQAPPLAGKSTVVDLHDVASGSGPKAIGAAKGQSNTDIAAGIGTRNGLLELPSTGEMITVTQPIGIGGTHQVQVPRRWTLEQANDKLSEVGAKAFSQNPLDRNFNGIDQRQLYGEIRRDITAALDKADPTGYSAAAWDAQQRVTERGLFFTEMLQKPDAYRLGQTTSGSQFNPAALQRWLANPRNAAEARDRLGEQGYQSLINVLTRGGGKLSGDIPAPGSGAAMDALMETYGRGKGGSPQFVGSFLRTAFPNFGAQYAGTPVRGVVPPAGKAAADALAIRGAREVYEPGREK